VSNLEPIKYKYFIIETNNVFIIFIKSFFNDVSKKWSFFYFYNFFCFFEKTNSIKSNTARFKLLFKFLYEFLFKYVLYVITTFTFFMLRTSLDLTLKFVILWESN
jgi:hypothetical protein